MAYGGVDVWIHIFLTSALVGGEWSASHPGRFTSGERALGTLLIGGWVDPGAGLDDVEKRIFNRNRDSNSDPSVFQPIASRYTNYAISVPSYDTDRRGNEIVRGGGHINSKVVSQAC
jgi:hypothetical protein